MKIEPVSKEQVNALIRSVGPISALVSGLDDVDLSKGRGIVDDSGRRHCMWTTEGHRIDVSVSSYGGLIVSKSKEVDSSLREGR